MILVTQNIEHPQEQADMVGADTRRSIMKIQDFTYSDDPIATLMKLKKQKPKEFLELVNEGGLFSLEMLIYNQRVVFKDKPENELLDFFQRITDLESPCKPAP